jgi:hypothetical protein
MNLSLSDENSLFAPFSASFKAASCSTFPSISYEAALKSAKKYTQVSSKFGQPVGLKAAENLQSQMGLVLTNTTPFEIADFRRFEPAGWPNFEFTWVCIKNQRFIIKG